MELVTLITGTSHPAPECQLRKFCFKPRSELTINQQLTAKASSSQRAHRTSPQHEGCARSRSPRPGTHEREPQTAPPLTHRTNAEAATQHSSRELRASAHSSVPHPPAPTARLSPRLCGAEAGGAHAREGLRPEGRPPAGNGGSGARLCLTLREEDLAALCVGLRGFE